jgi:hypothetical protein
MFITIFSAAAIYEPIMFITVFSAAAIYEPIMFITVFSEAAIYEPIMFITVFSVAAIYEPIMFITVFSTAAIFHILSHTNAERSLNKTKTISHVCKSLGGPFPSGFPTSTLDAYYIFPFLAT